MRRSLSVAVLLFGPALVAPAQEAQIETLIRQLGDGKFPVREAATHALEKDGEPARKQLEQAARTSQDGEVRRRARLLVQGLDRKVAGIVQQLAADSFDKREQATRALLAAGEVARKQLEEARSNPDIEIKRRAEVILQRLGPPRK